MINYKAVDDLFAKYKTLEDFIKAQPELPYKPHDNEERAGEKVIFMMQNNDGFFRALMSAFIVMKKFKMNFEEYTSMAVSNMAEVFKDEDDEFFVDTAIQAQDQMSLYLMLGFEILPVYEDETAI